MKAILITLCECTRMVEIASTPNSIKIPLSIGAKCYYGKHDVEPYSTYKFREFWRERTENMHGTGNVIIYKERASK